MSTEQEQISFEAWIDLNFSWKDTWTLHQENVVSKEKKLKRCEKVLEELENVILRGEEAGFSETIAMKTTVIIREMIHGALEDYPEDRRLYESWAYRPIHKE